MSGRYHPSDDDTNQPATTVPHRSDLDIVLRAVNHPYRRHVLRYLESAADPQPVADIAAAVIDAIDQQTYSERQQLAIVLRHRHLPLLTDAELIERTDRDLITATEMTSDAMQLLETARDYFD
ncbi:hypothetical protein [Haladaptatus sp. CMAA 1911]|uniref:DUF7344 domain-containing protein n=1 Tax=unclassified Haladaptatus TaxID=2622732 RepID=UPI003754D55B